MFRRLSRGRAALVGKLLPKADGVFESNPGVLPAFVYPFLVKMLIHSVDLLNTLTGHSCLILKSTRSAGKRRRDP